MRANPDGFNFAGYYFAYKSTPNLRGTIGGIVFFTSGKHRFHAGYLGIFESLRCAFLFLPTNLPAIEIRVQIDPFQPDPYRVKPTPVGNRPGVSDWACNQEISQCVDNFLACSSLPMGPRTSVGKG